VSERTADRGKGGITHGKQDDLSRIEDPAYQDGCIDREEDGFRSLPDGMKVPFHSVHGGFREKKVIKTIYISCCSIRQETVSDLSSAF